MPAEFVLEIKVELRSTDFQPERTFQTFLFITHTFIFCVSGSLFLSVSVCLSVSFSYLQAILMFNLIWTKTQ